MSQRLAQNEIAELLERHAGGDYGDFGEFYDLEVTDEMLIEGPPQPLAPDPFNKVNTLTGLAPIVSAYAMREHAIWVITEAGEKRTTVLLYAGLVQE